MKSVKNKIFQIALIAIFYISCSKDQTTAPAAGGPPNNAPVNTHKLDSVFFCQPLATTSYANFLYTFYLPQLDTVQNPGIKLYVYKFSGTSEFHNYTRQAGHFTFSLFDLGGPSAVKTRIIATW